MSSSPRLSVVVVAFRMATQVQNTIRSLSPEVQLAVEASDYEIVLAEVESDDMLGEQRARAAAANLRYLACPRDGVSPVPALIAGVAQTTAPILALVIDGARMMTPRVIRYSLDAFAIDPHAVVLVPGYHIGPDEQHAVAAAPRDQELLDEVRWLEDPYRLFAISTYFRGAHQHGYLAPTMESNVLVASREDYEALGGVDPRFVAAGGGLANLDIYRRLLEERPTQLFVLPGEGTFHQFHGGVTTRPSDDRDARLAEYREEYERIRGVPYRMPQNEPRILGAVTGWALPMLAFSVIERSMSRP